MPPRRSGQTLERISDRDSAPVKPAAAQQPPKQQGPPREKENVVPPTHDPIPVDARKPRIIPSDIIMRELSVDPQSQNNKRVVNLQDYVNRNKVNNDKPSESNNHSRPRQSDLSNQITSGKQNTNTDHTVLWKQPH